MCYVYIVSSIHIMLHNVLLFCTMYMYCYNYNYNEIIETSHPKSAHNGKLQ